MSKITGKAISIWVGYWFGDRASKKSLAFIRIAIYICILQSLYQVWNITDPGTFLRGQNISWYSPVGLLQLLGHQLPLVQFFIIIKYIALISSLLALVGLFTITSSVISFVSNQLLFCLLYSWGQPWVHGFNIIFLTQLAIIFSPSADFLSIDKLFLQAKKDSTNKPNWKYLWSVRLVQCTVALMFFNGFFYKWISSPLMFGWVFSDNLRNIIASEYLQHNLSIPSYLLFILDHPFIYKSIAGLNLLSQFSIILACVFVNRPWVRIIVATLVILELLGFDLIMHLGAPHWYSLLAVFIDWDYFINRLALFNHQDTTSLFSKEANRKLIITLFISCFLIFYLLVAFDPWYGLQEKLKPYPFTRFALYNQIEAQKPYSKHLPWPIEQFSFKVFTDSSFNYNASVFLNANLHQMNTYYYSEKNKSVFLNNCKNILLNGGFKNITSIALYKDYSEIKPYPYIPELNLLAEGLQCKIDPKSSKYIIVHKTIDTLNHKLVIAINLFGYDSTVVKFYIQPTLQQPSIPASFNYYNGVYITESSVNKAYIKMEVYSKGTKTIPDVYYIEPS